MENPETLASLNRLFIQALLRMGDVGEIDAACRLAAQGWSLLRHDHEREAERLNGVMHNLTSPRRRNTSKVQTEQAAQSSTIHPVTEEGAS